MRPVSGDREARRHPFARRLEPYHRDRSIGRLNLKRNGVTVLLADHDPRRMGDGKSSLSIGGISGDHLDPLVRAGLASGLNDPHQRQIAQFRFRAPTIFAHRLYVDVLTLMEPAKIVEEVLPPFV